MKGISGILKAVSIVLVIVGLCLSSSCASYKTPVNSDAARISVINKWHFNLFPNQDMLARAYMLAALMDPLIFEYADMYRENLAKDNGSAALTRWQAVSLTHTQSLSDFYKLPGKDPWGMRNDYNYPSYKKLLPSEMKAMSIYSKRITGKCVSLAVFNANAMIAAGTDPDNVVLYNLLMSNGMHHTIAVARHDDQYLLFDNVGCETLGDAQDFVRWLRRQTDIIGYFNHSFLYCDGKKKSSRNPMDFESINFGRGIQIDSNLSLMENMKRITHAKKKSEQIDILHTFKTRKDLVKTVLENRENKPLFKLAKYAYQSLDVKNPDLYLKASLITSRPKDLAAQFSSVPEVFSWMQTNTSAASIFSEDSGRIMTAEQVIVFKTGGAKDRAVLAYTILTYIGYHPVIKLTRNNAWISVGDTIYNLETYKAVDSINEEIEFCLN